MSKYTGYIPANDPFQNIINCIRAKPVDATKMYTYANVLNTTMEVHPIYTTNMYIPDYQRESFSRLRLMSHNLKIETGRWSRIPSDRRVCRCDNVQVQTEAHALIDCNLTHTIRLRYPALNFTDINSLLNESTHLQLLCKYIYDVLNYFR